MNVSTWRATAILCTSLIVSFSLFLLYVLIIDISGLLDLLPDIVGLGLILALTYAIGYFAPLVSSRIPAGGSDQVQTYPILHYIGIVLFYFLSLTIAIFEFGLGEGTELASASPTTVGIASLLTAGIVSIPGVYGANRYTPGTLTRDRIYGLLVESAVLLSIVWGLLTLFMGIIYVIGASVLSTVLFQANGPAGQTLAQNISASVIELSPNFLLAYADLVVIPIFDPLTNTLFGRLIVFIGLVSGALFMAGTFVGAGYEISFALYKPLFVWRPDENDD